MMPDGVMGSCTMHDTDDTTILRCRRQSGGQAGRQAGRQGTGEKKGIKFIG
jgi:hypothetical protein